MQRRFFTYRKRYYFSVSYDFILFPKYEALIFYKKDWAIWRPNILHLKEVTEYDCWKLWVNYSWKWKWYLYWKEQFRYRQDSFQTKATCQVACRHSLEAFLPISELFCAVTISLSWQRVRLKSITGYHFRIIPQDHTNASLRSVVDAEEHDYLEQNIYFSGIIRQHLLFLK